MRRNMDHFWRENNSVQPGERVVYYGFESQSIKNDAFPLECWAVRVGFIVLKLMLFRAFTRVL